MTTIQLSLPDEVAREAHEMGLFEIAAVETIFRDEMRRRKLAALRLAMDRMSAMDDEPMTLEEIQEEVRAVRCAGHAARS